MTKQKQELAWRIGGPQGSGVDTAARLFNFACAAGGLQTFGRREYYSNIIGRHSYYDVRVAHQPLTSHREKVDLLATFEAETLARHALAVVPDGAIIYNTADDEVELARLSFLNERACQALTDYLSEQDLPPTTAGVLVDARQRGVQTFGFPFDELISKLAEKLDVPKSVAQRTLNTIAVAASIALLTYDPDCLVRALEKIFPGRDKIINLNLAAAELTYDFVAAELDLDRFDFRLEKTEAAEQHLLINGNQAVALGKLAGGMTFQTYYPISPATDESVYLEGHTTVPLRSAETKDQNNKNGEVVIVQTEDELAAIAMASGAALTGARSATATSGPGFSLMVEGLGWAGANEVPLVVTLYQRGSPSTGLPTRTEQGDLLFAIRAGHGEFPRLVLASSDLTEAFYDAAQAFNYAEQYQVPVIHLLDKALASTTQTLPPFDVQAVRIERGEKYSQNGTDEGTFARFALTESGVSPRTLLGQPGGTHWLTGAEHTVKGLVTEDPVIREQMIEKRARKLDLAAREIPAEEKIHHYGASEAGLTIISWGSNKGAILEALELLEVDGISARLVQVRLLWPFPADDLALYLETAEPLVVVEANYSGQLAHLLRAQTGHQPDHLIVKYNGRPMSGQTLYQTLKTIAEGTEEERIVLRNPHE